MFGCRINAFVRQQHSHLDLPTNETLRNTTQQSTTTTTNYLLESIEADKNGRSRRLQCHGPSGTSHRGTLPGAPGPAEIDPGHNPRADEKQNSRKAKRLLEGLQNKDLLELYDVDYDDASSFTQAFESADALLLNVIMSKEESQQYRNILTAALAAKTIRHVIYSSNTECQLDHGIPHC
jgi:hypothetical protein